MNPIRHIRRVAGVLAGLACAWLGLAVAAPAAFASGQPPPIREKHPPLPAGHVFLPPGRVPVRVPVHTVVIGGMPGWQITLIAIGAALLAATATVVVYRAWTTRRKPVTATA
jgi:hypothetical protein